MADVKQFIMEARNQGISDDEIYNYLDQKGMLQGVQKEAQTQAIMQEGQKAQEFLEKPFYKQEPSKYLGRVAKELPTGIAQTFIKKPLQFLISTAEVPETIATGKATQKEYQVPLVGKFKSFQSEAEKRAGRIIDDKDPLYYALAPFAEVPMAAAELAQLGKFATATARVAGRVVKGIGGAVYKVPFSTTAKEAPLVQAYKANVPFLTRLKLALQGTTSPQKPLTAAETALKQKGLGGIGTQTGIGVRAKRASKNIWEQVINPKLKSVTNKVDMSSFFNEVEKTIIKNNPELSRRNDLLNSLNALKEDYKGVGKVSYEELQKFKEGWQKFIPDKAYKGQPIAGSFNDVKNIARSIARNKIISQLGQETKEAYLDYGNLKGLMSMGQKASQVGVVPTGGSFTGISAIYHTAVTPIATITGKTIYRIGQGLEFVGKAGAKTLGELFRGL